MIYQITMYTESVLNSEFYLRLSVAVPKMGSRSEYSLHNVCVKISAYVSEQCQNFDRTPQNRFSFLFKFYSKTIPQTVRLRLTKYRVN